MGKRINLLGKKFGVLLTISIAPSRKSAKGAKTGYWLVRCDCGREKEIQARHLMKRNHKICGTECEFISTKRIEVSCECCQKTYTVQRRSLKTKNRRLCLVCVSAIGARAVAGKPAHNRLPRSTGQFNRLYATYVKGAADRGLAFDLSQNEFGVITKQSCFYCGCPPSTIWNVARKGNPEPYIYNGIDRLDSDIGYVADNVVACCSICNYMKQELSVSDFFERIRAIFKHRCLSTEQSIQPGSGNRTYTP